jgi:hypothetical protein
MPPSAAARQRPAQLLVARARAACARAAYSSPRLGRARRAACMRLAPAPARGGAGAQELDARAGEGAEKAAAERVK